MIMVFAGGPVACGRGAVCAGRRQDATVRLSVRRSMATAGRLAVCALCLPIRVTKKRKKMKTEQDERQGQSPVCQSCAMPLTEEKLYGTNADGSPNRDYCVYCYRNGDFAQSCTMDGMIEHCAGMLAQVNAASGMNITREEYVAYMREVFPKLKRWRQASDR